MMTLCLKGGIVWYQFAPVICKPQWGTILCIDCAIKMNKVKESPFGAIDKPLLRIRRAVFMDNYFKNRKKMCSTLNSVCKLYRNHEQLFCKS